jgi:hypothetical protein
MTEKAKLDRIIELIATLSPEGSRAFREGYEAALSRIRQGVQKILTPSL